MGIATYTFSLLPQPSSASITKINDITQHISLTFCLEKKDFIYKDFIKFSIAHPDMLLSEWKTNKEPISYYDPLFKNAKHVFTGKVIFSLTATAKQYVEQPAYLYCTYYQKSEKKIKHYELSLKFADPAEHSHTTHTINTNLVLDDANKKLLPPQSSFKKYRKLLHTAFSLPFYNPHPTHTVLIFLIALYMSAIGIICIKKSTKLPKGSLCTFYSLLGQMFIAGTVFIVFKLIQVMV